MMEDGRLVNDFLRQRSDETAFRAALSDDSDDDDGLILWVEHEKEADDEEQEACSVS